ncbi:hypothetical protein JCM11251_004782 [Rhodosporidiobolus azoricus]
MSTAGSERSYLYPTGSRRVVTVPSWARNLPPDELSDDEGSPQNTGPVPSRPTNPTRGRSLSSIVRGNRTSSFGSPPPSAGLRTASSGDRLTPQNERQREISNGRSVASGSSSPSHPLVPTQPAPAHSVVDVQRGPEPSTSSAARSADEADKGWWTFTLPGKYLDRVHAYVHPNELDEKGKQKEREGRDSSDEEDDRRSTRSGRSRRSFGASLRSIRSRQSRDKDVEKQNYHRKMSQTMNLHLAPPNVFSINQTQTPGWSTPWTPFRREEDPRSYQDPFDLAANTAAASETKRSKFESFILQNPFSPLFFRFINLILNGCTLGLAAHIRKQEHNAGVIGVMGTSTLFAIVIAPFAIIHIFITLYIEYFGLPIGLWKISTKMFYTLTDLLFICLYSAVLSLAFDDLFTSPLKCTDWTPYARYNEPAPAATGTADVAGSLADSICSQQIAQVTFIFLSVVFYIFALIVALFRIFHKVSSRRS